MAYLPEQLRPLKFKDPEEVQAKVDAYFAEADEKDEPYLITGLACALDVTRATLLANHFGLSDKLAPEIKLSVLNTLKRAREKIHNYAEKYLYTGKNQVAGIFALKCNWGWQDRQEIQVSGPGGGPILMIHRAAQQALEEAPLQQAIEHHLAEEDPLALE